MPVPGTIFGYRRSLETEKRKGLPLGNGAIFRMEKVKL